jgi:transketolase
VYAILGQKYDDFDFIVSKGHGYLSQLVVLEHFGIIDSSILNEIGRNGSVFGGHPDRGQPGITASTGSLGHGLGLSVGLSIAKKLRRVRSKITVCLISDGEMQEGSTWENLINAVALKSTNLLLIIDFNNMQTVGTLSETHPNLLPLSDRLRSVGWNVLDIDGHSEKDIIDSFSRLAPEFSCEAIVAKTIKGKGVSFMESNPIWHYRSPSSEEYSRALNELGFGENDNA